MKKVLALVVLTLVLVGFTNAQTTNKLKLGVGAYIGLPVGTFGDVTSMGYGGVVQGEYEFEGRIIGTLTTGYLMFPGKDATVSGFSYSYGDWSVIPILVGAKYFFGTNLYGTAQIGLNMTSYTNKVPSYNYLTGTITTVDLKVSDSNFGFNIGVGYDMGNLDFLVKYGQFASDASAISLTALYKFPL